MPDLIIHRNKSSFNVRMPLIIVGGGGCGLVAALAASDCGVDTLILERDPKLWGTTSMSTGLIPAAGMPEQAKKGIEDSPELLVLDVLKKTHGEVDSALVKRLAEQSADTVKWLQATHQVALSHIDDFLYPGHSAMRMYGMPNRSGAELMAALEAAAHRAGVSILTEARVTSLFVEDDVISGVRIERPDGTAEDIGCDALILACCGFAGNPQMVKAFMPELEFATFHGHPGNEGHAVLWGQALGAQLKDMHSYQGHGGLAHGHAIPILWPLIMEGGYQINRQGHRFSNESLGYSEQAVKVLAQEDHVAWSIFDARLYDLMMRFDDFQQAVAAGAILESATLAGLAGLCGLDPSVLESTDAIVNLVKQGVAADPFGRDFMGKPALTAPFYAAKVTGALFHTQGGLQVDEHARVIGADGEPMKNLYAGGGAARGISGPGCDGYMAGNGLLTATTLGKLAGRHAASQLKRSADYGDVQSKVDERL